MNATNHTQDSIPKYISKNTQRIQNLEKQDLGEYSDAYRRSIHQSLIQLYEKFPRKITREDLTKLYINWDNPALAFYATMVWGMIDVHKKKRFLAIQKNRPACINKIMDNLKSMISKGDLSGAFESCFKGGYNFIDGIGPSYFTKIFFFLGQADENLISKPLIMDKWTINAYFALSCELNGIASIKHKFNIPSSKSLQKYKSIPLRYQLDNLKDAYIDFVDKLNIWACAIGVNPDKLEQFVFGIDLRKDKTSLNPRLEIIEIAKRHIYSS
jgi:hypothetical protein